MSVTLTHIANGSSAHNAAPRQAHHNEMGWNLPRVLVHPYDTFCEWIMVFKQIAMVKQTTKH